MKVSCEIIKDLLPLYHDGVCSNESKMMIEEHLSNCRNCKVELQGMDGVLPIANVEQNLNEANAVKKLSREWKKGMLKSLLEGILIAAIIGVIIYCFVSVRVIPN